jgi:CheY-like chemotaxis protein
LTKKDIENYNWGNTLNVKRVLLVDDNEDLAWSLANHLNKDKNDYSLTVVNDAKAALKSLEQTPFHLVVSDIRMPQISGLDLLLEIREKYPKIKVIIMTAYGSSEIQEEANKRGCFKYLEKPVDANELRKLILEGIEDKKGFEGTISDLHLSDLIQMNCLGRLSNALKIKKGNTVGMIFFDGGNIINAMVNDLEGEEAFYEILSWEGGRFSIERGISVEKNTINKGWQTLLLEGLRRADEQKKTDENKSQKALAQQKKMAMGVLSEINDLKGVLVSAVFSGDGSPIYSKLNDKAKERYEITDIAPIIANIYQIILNTKDKLSLGKFKETSFEYAGGAISLYQIADSNNYFVIVLDAMTHLNLIKLEVKKRLVRLKEAFG